MRSLVIYTKLRQFITPFHKDPKNMSLCNIRYTYNNKFYFVINDNGVITCIIFYRIKKHYYAGNSTKKSNDFLIGAGFQYMRFSPIFHQHRYVYHNVRCMV